MCRSLRTKIAPRKISLANKFEKTLSERTFYSNESVYYTLQLHAKLDHY